MSLRVLFVYPNLKGMNMLPPSVGLLSAILKESGHTVDMFDTTYYEKLDGDHSEADSDQMKADKLMVRPFKMPKEILLKRTNVYEDFEKKVSDFHPDLLAVSATEDMFLLGIKLLKTIRRQTNILTILGGVFATFAPELVLSYPEIDLICRGEGEETLRILCDRLDKGQAYDDIPNLWIKKKDGSIKKNPLKMADMDANPLIDMSIFEEGRFYRPMGGKVWRMFPVETHRGCAYQCAYCNSPSQEELYRQEEGKSYLRRKSFENMRRELLFYKNDMQAEFFYFWADTFFSWKKGEFEEFCEMYEEVRVPFWCQTRIETVTRERLKKLKEIGCARMAYGIEHGNEKFRKEVLKRRVTNDAMIKNFKIANDVGIPFSVNNIMGFPDETYELAFDSIRLNRQIEAVDRNAYAFTPFAGTSLRRVCNSRGYLKETDIVHSILVNGSLLDMPQFPKEKINGLIRTFNMYVKFPQARWGEIKKAEEDTPEGNKIYAELKQEYMERFWKLTDNFEEAA
ncbi:MAG: radical SAM protein [Candidatus Omnitrophota bacterium]